MNFKNINVKSYVLYVLLIGVVLYGIYRLINDVYLKFYENVLLAQNSKNEFIHEKSITLPYISNEYISNWGAFGDFVGGTLNPILTFLSVLLLLFTILQNRKALKISSEELKESRIAQQMMAKSQDEIQITQMLQRLDSKIFKLLEALQKSENEIKSSNDFQDFYRKSMEEDIIVNKSKLYDFFQEGSLVFLYMKKLEYIFSIIRIDIISQYRKDLNFFFNEYVEEVKIIERQKDYNKKIIWEEDLDKFFKYSDILNNQSYENKENFRKNQLEMNFLVDIHCLIGKYVALCKTHMSLEMQQLVIIYSVFNKELCKYTGLYGFSDDLHLSVLNGGDQIPNNLLVALFFNNNARYLNDLITPFYEKDKVNELFGFNFYGLKSIKIYSYFIENVFSINSVADINKAIFEKVASIRLVSYLEEGMDSLEVIVDKDFLNFKINRKNEDGIFNTIFPILHSRYGVKMILWENIFYLNLGKNNEMIITGNEKYIIKQIILKENPL